tara:strand:+ start:13922 stop:17971 length:4050 start_codon:yes stop_codon:yes gene_type:complete
MVKSGVIGEGQVIMHRIPFIEGETPRTLTTKLGEHLPKQVPIEVAKHGRLLLEDDYDEPLADGDEIVLCGHVASGVEVLYAIGQALILVAVSVAVNYALAALNPQPTVPDVPQDRGEDSSATYSWSGIQTNYGQGFTVPAVYGRHGVGGQVISTDVETGPISGTYFFDSLNIILALSEGPIDKVGDTVILAQGNDFLGTRLGTSQSNGLVPNFIRVNDTPLVSDGTLVTGGVLGPFSGQVTWLGSTTPNVGVGDSLFLYDTTNNQFVTGSTDVIQYELVQPLPFSGDALIQIVLREIPAAWEPYVIANPGAQFIVQTAGQGITGQSFVVDASSFGYPLYTILPEAGGAQAFLRPGTITQPPLPSTGGGPFTGAATTFSPQRPLNEFGQEGVYAFNSGDDPVAKVTFVLSAPSGIYQQDQTGSQGPYTIYFGFTWRYQGETGWRLFQNAGAAAVGTEVRLGPWAWTIEKWFTAPVSGNIEVRCFRDSVGGGSQVVSSILWRDVVFSTNNVLSYPRVSLLGLTLEANARWNGGLPNVNARVDGIQLRVWDVVEGFSGRTWEVPAAPFDWHINPPGRNPAWILLDYLLSDWGLAAYLTEDDLDLPAFAAWAVYCDEDPNSASPWGEARYTCDVVMDRARPAWEWVLAVLATGRASPVSLDGKISIVYEYRDAHAQGSVSVPAKSVQQLFTTTNLSDLTVTWLPRSTRPTAFIYQFLNEDFEWRQDVLPLEDGEANFNDVGELFPEEYRPAQVQAFGQTRPSQIFRDSVYRHRINRLVARRIDFRTGRWALASQIGDLIDVEAEVLRPFPSAPGSLVSDVAISATIWQDVTASDQAYVSNQSLAATGGIKVRLSDGTPDLTTYTVLSTTEENGVLITLIELPEVHTWAAGAAAVVGTIDKLTQTYQIVGLGMNEDLSHNITALQWAPEVHDVIAPTSFTTAAASSLVIPESPATQQDATIPVKDIKVIATADGMHSIEFARLPQLQSVSAQVYVRETLVDQSSTTLRVDSYPRKWVRVGETQGNSVAIPRRLAHRQIDVSVVFESFNGESQAAETGVITTVKLPEFTQIIPPSVSNLVWHEVQGTLMLTWDEITARGVAFYEVREGTSWNGGRVLARTNDTRHVFETPPQAGSVMIVVQMEDGSQSQPLTELAVPTWEPFDTYKIVSRDDLTLFTGSGTLTDVQINGDGDMELTEGSFTGNYVTDIVDATFLAPFLWRVNIEAHELDGATVDELDFELGEGEAAWWTVDGRGASPALPGVDWQRTVDDLSELTVDSLDGELVHGPRGEVGSHTRVLFESRFSSDNEGASGWSDWAEHVDGVRVSHVAQFRVTLDRETLRHEAKVRRLVIVAHI